MKFLVGLAILSVAFANPAVQPVVLPEAPQPVIEDAAPEAVELPNAAIPAFEMQGISILPLFIPQEISRMLNDFGEIREDAVQVVDIFNPEDSVDAVNAEDVAVAAPEEPSPLNFVDYAEEAAADMVAPEEPSPLNIVDNAEDVIAMAAPEEPSPLNIVDNAEDVIDMGAPEEPSPLNFVDNAEDMAVPFEGSPLNIVDNAEDMAVPFEGSPLNIVDNAQAPEETPISPVIVVDGPLDSVDGVLIVEEVPTYATNNNLAEFIAQMARAFNVIRQADGFMAPPGDMANRFPNQPMLRTL